MVLFWWLAPYQGKIGREKLKIKDLRNGMKRVDVEAKVLEKGETREVMSRYKNETYRVANVIISDGTGQIKLTLWNDQIEQVNENDTVKIENGYVTSFRGEIQLNVGRYGKLTVA
jgi:replication factor A1